MSLGAPDRKVGVVTFNSDVQIIGDGSKPPQVITGDKLLNFDWLLENGTKKASELLMKPIKETS